MAENKENIDDLYELLNLLKTGKDKVLYVIYHYSMDFMDQTFCPLSKSEVAKIVGLSVRTVSSIFSELLENGELIKTGNSRWTISDSDAMRFKKFYIENVKFTINWDDKLYNSI